MDISSRVKNLRKKLNLTQSELAELAGTEQRSISRIELGKISAPRNINELAEALKTTPEYLQFGVGEMDNATVMANAGIYLPLVSFVQAGAWSDINEIDISTAQLYPCPIKCSVNSFIVKVEGESMLPEFTPGTLLYVDPEAGYDNLSYVVARLDDENQATFKQLIIDGNKKYLKALNPDWPNKFIEINGKCTIVGKVVFTGKEL
jgi:SOS-response transcriptional repressor LexA